MQNIPLLFIVLYYSTYGHITVYPGSSPFLAPFYSCILLHSWTYHSLSRQLSLSSSFVLPATFGYGNQSHGGLFYALCKRISLSVPFRSVLRGGVVGSSKVTQICDFAKYLGWLAFFFVVVLICSVWGGEHSSGAFPIRVWKTQRILKFISLTTVLLEVSITIDSTHLWDWKDSVELE